MLETVDRTISITGKSFLDSVALECLFFEVYDGGFELLEVQKAQYKSGTEIECEIPYQVFQ